ARHRRRSLVQRGPGRRDHRPARDHQSPLQAQERRYQDHRPAVLKETPAMAETSVVVDHTRLTAFIADALCAMKMPRERATVTAELIVRTDLRGVDSHGIDMLAAYRELCKEGLLVLDRGHGIQKAR